VTLTIPDSLRSLPITELREMLCRANPGVWAEQKRGFTNAPFHDEWYSLMINERRLCVVAPREHAKSETFTVNGTAWRSCYRPGWWTYAFAATADLAAELKARIDTAVMEADPHLVLNARSLSKMETIYANGSRITVAGVGKSVRGAHPDTVCGDDVLDDSSAGTEHQRRKMETWWFGAIGGMSHPGTSRMIKGYGRLTYPPTQVFLVGTPFHSQDLLMKMRQNRLYHFRRYAAEYDPDDLVPGSWAVEVRNG
jgi:hypothetical protein